MNQGEFLIKHGVLTKYQGSGGDIQVPAEVKKIGKKAFAGCAGLTRVTLPQGLREIGDRAFAGCTGLNWVQLPEGLRAIGSGAFAGCSGLFGIELPQGVRKIGKGAFAGCSSLARLVVPVTVKKMNRATFRGCPMPVSVPYLPVKQFKKKRRPQAAQHFAAARLAKLKMRKKVQTSYLRYIRSRRKRLYPAAVEREELLWLMLEEDMVPRKEIRQLAEEANRQGKWDAKAAVMAYGRDKERKQNHHSPRKGAKK